MKPPLWHERHRLSDFQNLFAWPQKCEHLRAGFGARPSIAVLGGGIFIGANRILAPLISPADVSHAWDKITQAKPAGASGPA